MRVIDIIDHFDLKPHPEGGFYKETYRSLEEIHKDCLDKTFNGNRNYSTCIYFLLTTDIFSAFHKVNQDEIWHFYDGAPIIIHMISPQGNYSNVTIGNDFNKGQIPQYVVPAQYWFAATVIENNKKNYGFVGCTVAPGFDFADFELPKREDLISKFPEHETIITEFTRL